MNYYAKQLEEENEKLRELLSQEQLSSDKYKMYYDLISKGGITDHRIDYTYDGQPVHEYITLKSKDLSKYEMIVSMIEERRKLLKRYQLEENEKEIRNEEKITHYIKIAGIIIAPAFFLYLVGWCIYYAWIFVP